MSGSLFDESHLVELGQEYELFVGAYFEKILKCLVVYQGQILNKSDGGIDLIAISQQKTYLIQCKNYLPSKEIHENVINQLSGATRVFASRHPSACGIEPVIISTCPLDSDALFSAKINGITVKRLDYSKKTVGNRIVLFNDSFSTENYFPMTTGLNMLPDYESRLQALIEMIQTPHDASHNQSNVSFFPAPIDRSAPVFRDPEKVDIDLVKAKAKEERIAQAKSDYSRAKREWLGCLIPILFIVACLVFGPIISSFSHGFDDNEPAAPTQTPRVIVQPTLGPSPEDIPSNGTYRGLRLGTYTESLRTSSLTVKTPDNGLYYCLIFVDAKNPSRKNFAVFVHPDSEKIISVPELENQLVYITCGKKWYGYTRFFGDEGYWSTSDDIFDFSKYTWTLSLKKVTGGDWETKDIDRYEVPFLQ